MAKQRKTRKQKLQADFRHQYPQQNIQIQATPPLTQAIPQTNSYSYNLQTSQVQEKIIQPEKQNATVSIIYQYASADLRKTAFITIAVILGELFVYIISLHNKM